MNFKKNLCMLAMLCSTQQALANNFDFSGTLVNDNTMPLFNSSGLDGTFSAFSSSLNDGGFDPTLAIFTDSGTLLSQQNDWLNLGSTLSNDVSYTYGMLDTNYSQFLTANNAIANFAQFTDFSIGPNLSNAITFYANPNFTLTYACTNGLFCGVNGIANYTPDWAFQTLNVAKASTTNPVPEPGALALLSIGLVGLGFKRKKTTTG